VLFCGFLVNGRKVWLKRGLWALALLLVAAAGVSVMSVLALRRVPDWYQPDTSTADQRRSAADRIENMLIMLRNWGGHHHAQQVAAQQIANSHSEVQAKAVLLEKTDESFPISFTDDELTAFFNKWANVKNRRAWFDQYVDDPRLVIRGKQLIIVGKAKDMGLVISLIFEPRLDSDGNLDLHLAHVLGGVLPLPDAMWWNQRKTVEQALRNKLPIYQNGADLNSEGLANGDAGSAAMNQLLLATLQYKAAPAVIFVPIELQHLSQSLPVKITALTIHDHQVEMTAQQMSEQQRKAFIEQLKSQPQETPTVPPTENQ
jgi:hypothetical protein